MASARPGRAVRQRWLMRARGAFYAVLIATAYSPAVAQAVKTTPQLRRKEALDHASALGQRFQSFSDPLIAVRSLGRLGEIVCPYAHAYAGTLFTNAETILATVRNLPEHDGALAREGLIARAASCDVALARRMRPSLSMPPGDALRAAGARL